MAGNYLEFHFNVDPVQPASEILVAELGYLGFESFVEHDYGITAYIPKEEYEEDLLVGLHILQSDEFEITYNVQEIEKVNWNEEWESNFRPIRVGDICEVRAPFHEKSDVEYDIVIEPKMSFGTGHHATTHMMIQHILNTNCEEKSILDMGCGTGILAILTAMKGARKIDAIDIDNWCYLNTLENIKRNDCEHIQVEEGGAELLEGRSYDYIFANINKNILLKDVDIYKKCLKKDACLFLSGFYDADVSDITAACKKLQLKFVEKIEREDWVALKFCI